MKLNEVADLPKKAGFLPYVIEDGKPVFMFMLSSDPKFGGGLPAIAKGEIDGDESPKEAGMREAEEELGLKRSNLKLSTVKEVWRGEITGLLITYTMVIYAGEVKNRKDFGTPHYETESVHWMTKEEFGAEGRPSQQHIVDAAFSKISS